jgi:hypothetical protein
MCDGCFKDKGDVREMGDMNYCEACAGGHIRLVGVVGCIKGYLDKLEENGEATTLDLRSALMNLPAPYNVLSAW